MYKPTEGMTAPPPFLRTPRDFVADVTGYGRPMMLGLVATAAVCAAGCVFFGGIAVYEARYAGDQIQRYAVWFGPEGKVAQVSTLDSRSPLRDTAYLAFAERWVREMRARPPGTTTADSPTQKVMLDDRAHAQSVTDRRVWPVLAEWLKKTDDLYRDSGAEITDIAPVILVDSNGNLLRKPDRAQVSVTWTEQAVGKIGGERKFGAVLTIYDQGGSAENKEGLWVVDVQQVQGAGK